jgi:hypothetical protein
LNQLRLQPTAQIAYLNHFLNPGSFHLAEALFKRFLRTSPWPELWKFYLVYVRRVNTGPNTRDSVRMAYEFALNHVGQDKDSTEIWVDFIQFLKAGEVCPALPREREPLYFFFGGLRVTWITATYTSYVNVNEC